MLIGGVSLNEGTKGWISSCVVDGGGGVSSNQSVRINVGKIASPADMFDTSRDEGTCIGSDGTNCCGMSVGVSGLGEAHGVSDGVSIQRAQAVAFLIVYPGEE